MAKYDLYISFYDEDKNKIVPEYIPGETTAIGMWFKNKLDDIYSFLGMQTNYWNLRHLLDAEMRKRGDILFIMHVLEEHDGRPSGWRERRFYLKLLRLYRNEIEHLILPYLIEMKELDPIVHPYYLAYKERWIRPKNSQTRRFYHGMSSEESRIMTHTFIEQINSENAKERNKVAYRKRKLSKKGTGNSGKSYDKK